MKKTRTVSLALLVAVVAVAVGCRGPSERNGQASPSAVAEATSTALAVAVTSGTVYPVGDAALDLSVQRDGANVTDAAVHVTGDMTHAGMVPVEASAREISPGVYQASDFSFTMAGDWVLTIEVTLADGTVSRHEVAVRAQRP